MLITWLSFSQAGVFCPSKDGLRRGPRRDCFHQLHCARQPRGGVALQVDLQLEFRAQPTAGQQVQDQRDDVHRENEQYNCESHLQAHIHCLYICNSWCTASTLVVIMALFSAGLRTPWGRRWNPAFFTSYQQVRCRVMACPCSHACAHQSGMYCVIGQRK